MCYSPICTGTELLPPFWVLIYFQYNFFIISSLFPEFIVTMTLLATSENIKTSKNDYTVFYLFKSLKICESMAI
jgi:hypothetical protein